MHTVEPVAIEKGSLVMVDKFPASMVDQIGNTRLVPIQRLAENSQNNQIFAKLEGDNPAGSVKDRPAANMIKEAAARGDIKPGDALVEATSGNTGIALAMVAATMGFKMKLIMADNMTDERKALMQAYGAELILVSAEEGIEYARDLATEMADRGEALLLNQFGNPDNPAAHYKTTGPELWEATNGQITHFVSSMGTTGTIMGVSRYLKEKNPAIQIIGVQPEDGSSIPGIRRWPKEYLPTIFEPERVDQVIDVNEHDAEEMARKLARTEGILGGVSSGGALVAAMRLLPTLSDAVMVTIVCDRGDRYLSSGLFPATTT